MCTQVFAPFPDAKLQFLLRWSTLVCKYFSICLLSCSTYTSFRLEVRYGNKIYKKVTAITPSQASMWVTELVQLSTEMSEKQHFFFHHQLWDKKCLIQSVTDLVSLTNIACLLDAVWWGIWATTFLLACSWCLSVGHPLGHRFRMRSPKVLNWLQINCVQTLTLPSVRIQLIP